MPELSTETLPLLPLTSGVVLPGMVVTATLETPESRSASSAAGDTGGHLLLVPKVDGRYATVGTVAKIENAGELPNGQLAVVVRGLHRARIGAGVAGTGTATWVEIEPIDDPPATERATQLAREYRAVVENILEARGAAQVAELLRGMTDPGQIADTAIYSPDLSFEQKVEVLEAVDVERAPREGAGLGPGHPGRGRAEGPHPQGRLRGHGEDASASSSCASSWPPSARSSARARTARARSTPTGPRSPKARCPTPCVTRWSGRSAAWSGPASRAPSTAGSAPGSTP